VKHLLQWTTHSYTI